MTYTLDTYFKKAGLKNPIAFAPFITMNPQKIPMKHQVSGLNKLLTNEYWGLYDQPGTGKTLTSHAFFLYWVSEGQKTVAVMPPNLVYQFEEELYDVYQGADKYVTSHILDDNPVKRKKLYAQWKADKSWPQLLCMSYQMFSREYKIWMKEYRVGIFDEAQALKNSNSGFFKHIHEWQHQKGGTSATFMTGHPDSQRTDRYLLPDRTD